jgi:hypothetical protein
MMAVTWNMQGIGELARILCESRMAVVLFATPPGRPGLGFQPRCGGAREPALATVRAALAAEGC